MYPSLYRRVFQIPAKTLVTKERAKSAKLIACLLICGGFIQGFITMDFAFDLKLYREDYSIESGEAAFKYYTTILNNRLVNFMTFMALVGTHLCAFYGWTFNIITRTKAETDMSLAFRNIFFQYCTGSVIYISFVIPRYIIFISDFRDVTNQELTFCLSMVKDWGLVIIGRVLMSMLNINVMISLFKLLKLLIASPVDKGFPITKTTKLITEKSVSASHAEMKLSRKKK